MPNNPKLFIRKSCVEITFRMEEGLPLIAVPFIKLLVESIYARAQTLFPVTLCHLLVMSNHVHQIIVVDHPEMVPRFFGYLKAELGHAVNRMLGREKHTVWCDGYDSPRILDAKKAIERVVYIYTNPQRAQLADTIEDYPNLSTWEAFLYGGQELECYRIPRTAIPEVPHGALSRAEQDRIEKLLRNAGMEESTLFINPDAWMECFPETEDADAELIMKEIVTRIRAEEARLRAQRKSPVLGPKALRSQPIRAKHTPKKRGKRMICLSSCKKLRTSYIDWVKLQQTDAKEWFADWSIGATTEHPPPGMFAPGGVLFSNLIPRYASPRFL